MYYNNKNLYFYLIYETTNFDNTNINLNNYQVLILQNENDKNYFSKFFFNLSISVNNKIHHFQYLDKDYFSYENY